MPSSAAALSYHEPSIVTILILASFLVLENAINYVFDRLLLCGLIGQIAVGVAWGAPGANWLSQDVQSAVMQLGYLGLVLLVFEGGLSTDLQTVKSNLSLSSLVALIGIGAPIGLSFSLQGFMDITPVQAFAAGAALCSTSLGTTFTILSTSGLNTSRLGVVLSSAAMMDDIVGLVMSGIISSLGQSSDFSATTAIRPVFESIAFAVIIPLICVLVVKPLTAMSFNRLTAKTGTSVDRALASDGIVVAFHTLILAALVAGASYAGTSNLFAAYLAGAVITWWDNLCQEIQQSLKQREQGIQHENLQSSDRGNAAAAPTNIDSHAPEEQSGRLQANYSVESNPEQSKSSLDNSSKPRASAQSPENELGIHDERRGTIIFEKYYAPALRTILKPFFFASIGFAIPITQMFSGSVVWRGIVYTILMIIGKLFCGLFLVRFAGPVVPTRALKKCIPSNMFRRWPWPMMSKKSETKAVEIKELKTTDSQDLATNTQAPAPLPPTPSEQPKRSIPTPMSLYPAALLGSAMVARGEIGFVISSIAETNGILGAKERGQSSELFLVVTWAILLCTLLGPIVVGLMVKRVRRLQALERSRQTGKGDPLGMWGVIGTAR